jgi:hypothetical protein
MIIAMLLTSYFIGLFVIIHSTGVRLRFTGLRSRFGQQSSALFSFFLMVSDSMLAVIAAYLLFLSYFISSSCYRSY